MPEENKKLNNSMLATGANVRFTMALKYGCSFRYSFRLFSMLLDSCILAPISLFEKVLYHKKIEAVEAAPPIFIIGHWRSGTTHLHNLISQDESFSSFTTYDALFPEASIILDSYKESLNKFLPKSRQIDNVSLSVNSPQEEEFAIARLSEASYYHSFTYPDLDRDLFERFVILEKASPRVLKQLEDIYHFLVKKKYFQEQKPVLLKNPVNTGRVDFLLKVFPKAKFIYIQRDQAKIFQSTKNMLTKLRDCSQLKEISETELEENIVFNYHELLKFYEKAKLKLADNQLAEIKYEDLVAKPLDEIKYIYQKLNLKFSESFEVKLNDYLESIKDYQTNNFPDSDKLSVMN
ncbi:MAG: sulfotransferase [Candidatus Caenarcaniphilales bacterium]|nr:sulfotransferase [Candidatus Caenarcaniphilales bacterium]